MLTQLERIPDGLLDVSATDLYRIFPEPTLLHLQGIKHEPLFISLLLHGNETSGLEAVQLLLKKYARRSLPRAITIFFGNVSAARLGLRRLEAQPDYNRVWPGTDLPESDESKMMQAIVKTMAQRNVFASVDIHNNSGQNPHYACINKLDADYLHLASLFSNTIVYFLRPRGVSSLAFSEYCPSVTLECGQPGDNSASREAFEYIDLCMNLTEISGQSRQTAELNIFHTVARVLVPGDITFSFSGRDADLNFTDDIELFNFRELPTGTSFGMLRNAEELLISCEDEQGSDITDEYFTNDQTSLTLIKSVMPSMLTTDERIVRQDCLCYLMERIYLD